MKIVRVEVVKVLSRVHIYLVNQVVQILSGIYKQVVVFSSVWVVVL
jgi:hypothetical protein